MPIYTPDTLLVLGGENLFPTSSLSAILQGAAGQETTVVELGGGGVSLLAADWATRCGLRLKTLGASARTRKVLEKEMTSCLTGSEGMVVVFPEAKEWAVETALRAGMRPFVVAEEDLSREEQGVLARSRFVSDLVQGGGDGVTHVNCYSRGETALGRYLSNFSPMSPPYHGTHGEFHSVEGLWYSMRLVGSGMSLPDLHWLTGLDAKKRGDEAVKSAAAAGSLKRIPIPFSDFSREIEAAVAHKLACAPEWVKRALWETRDLPFAHYYVYGGKPVSAGYDWLRETLETARRVALSA